MRPLSLYAAVRFPTATHARPTLSRDEPPPPLLLSPSLSQVNLVRWAAADCFYLSRGILFLPQLEKKTATRRITLVGWACFVVGALPLLAIKAYDPDYKMTWLGKVLVAVTQFGPGENCWVLVCRRLH